MNNRKRWLSEKGLENQASFRVLCLLVKLSGLPVLPLVACEVSLKRLTNSDAFG